MFTSTPVRANLLEPEESLERFGWSKYGEHLKPASQRPARLRVDRLLGEKGIPKDSAAGWKHFARLMERRRLEEAEADYRAIRRGWCLGSEAFRQELLAAARAPVSAIMARSGGKPETTSPKDRPRKKPGGWAPGRGGPANAPQGGQAEGAAGPPAAPGNHHEPEMDRALAADGQLDQRFQPAASKGKNHRLV